MRAQKDNEYRDERGVKKPNYRRFKDVEKVTPEQSAILLDMFRRGVLGEETAEGGEIVRKHPGGRPRKYPRIEDFEDKISEYIDYIAEKNADGAGLIPDIEGFCLFAGIDRVTLFDWEKSRGAEYSDAIKRLRNGIAAYKKQLGMAGKIPPIVLAMDFNNNHGYVQQQNIEIKANDRLRELPSRDEIARRIPPEIGDAENPIK